MNEFFSDAVDLHYHFAVVFLLVLQFRPVKHRAKLKLQGVIWLSYYKSSENWDLIT